MRFLKGLTLLVLLPLYGLAQETTISYECLHTPIAEVLNDLEKKYNLHFSYTHQNLGGKRISISASNQTLPLFLKELLSQVDLRYEIVDHRFITIKKTVPGDYKLSVYEATGQAPLPYSSIRISGTNEGYVTDIDGTLTIPYKAVSGKVIECSFIGYKTASITLDSVRAIDIIMQPDVTELNEVVITEYINRGILLNKNSSAYTILPHNMEILPGLAEPDILLSSQILPGVNANNESASEINMRGSPADHTQFYWNNIPLYSPAHYFGNITAFIPAAVGHVDIYKNYLPVQYGNAVGGLYAIETKAQQDKDLSIEASSNLTHGDIYTQVNMPKSHGNILFAARRSYNDWIHTPTFNAITDKVFDGSITDLYQNNITDNTFDYTSRLIFSDINAVYTLHTSKHELKISAIRAKSTLNFNSKDEEQINQSIQQNEVENNGYGLEYSHLWTDNFTTTINGAYANYTLHYFIHNLTSWKNDPDFYESRYNNLNNKTLGLENKITLHPNHQLQLGYQLNMVKSDYDLNTTTTFPDAPSDQYSDSTHAKGTIAAIYLDYNGKIGQKWHLGSGLRYNHYNFLADTYDPQIRLKYTLSDAISIKSSWGTFHQHTLSLQESDFTLSNTSEHMWMLANSREGVHLLSGQQFALGMIIMQNGWIVDFEAYLKTTDNMNASKVIHGFDPYYLSDETIRGADLLIKKRFKYLRTWLSYSYQHSNVHIPELEITDIPSRQNVHHQIQTSASYTWRSFEFSIGYTLKSGIPYTPATGLQEMQDDDLSYYQIAYDQTNSLRLPNYQRLDLSIWYKYPHNIAKKLNAEIGISVLNLTNHRNIFNRTYTIAEREDESLYVQHNDQQLYGIMPNASIRLRF